MRPVKSREVGDRLILTIDDQASVNDGQSDTYRQSIYQMISERSTPRVALDLGTIDFLSSSGVAFLIGLRRRIQGQGGTLVVFSMHPHVKDLLRVMKIAPLFQIADDEGSALDLFPPLPAP